MHLLKISGAWGKFALLSFVMTSCHREDASFSPGDLRSVVYSRMGPPSNQDDHVVAFWISGNRTRSQSWKHICQQDGIVAVFDEHNKSLMAKISISASGIYPTMSDEDILSYIRDYGPK